MEDEHIFREGIRRILVMLPILVIIAVIVWGARAAAVPLASERNVNQALAKAKTCLLAHGARTVTSGLVGGAAGFSHAGVAFWTYTVAKAYPVNTGRVLGVKSYSFPNQMKAGTRLIVKRCVVASTR